MFSTNFLQTNGSVTAPPASQCFTSSGAWSCCPGATLIQVVVIGGGGGGGDSTNYYTSGCPTFCIAGGGGAGGGGISVCCFTGACVCSTGTIVIGAGGTKGIPATAGGASSWCSGTSTVSAAGGAQGQFSCTQNGASSNPGLGGAGNYTTGNQGGAGRSITNGCNAASALCASCGGGGGGGAKYCNVLPTSCNFTSPGAGSPARDIILPEITIPIGARGAGGKGGNGGLNFQGDTNGGNGGNGFVQVIQYF